MVWFGDGGGHLEEAQVSVANFLDSGGKIVMSMALQEFFTNDGDLLDFAGVDSVTQMITLVLNGTVIEPTHPDSLDLPQLDDLPELEVESSSGTLFYIWGLQPLPSAKVLYRLPDGQSSWEGSPVVGVWHSSDRLAFFDIPLHHVNKDGKAEELLISLLEGLG